MFLLSVISNAYLLRDRILNVGKNTRFLSFQFRNSHRRTVIDSATTRNNVYTTNDRISDGLNGRKTTEVEKERLVHGCARPS